MRRRALVLIPLAACALAAADDPPGDRLVAALLGETPLVSDLRTLTDEIGGRPTGSDANRRAVRWGLERFEDAGVAARREPFSMPMRWIERSSSAHVSGDATLDPRAVANPFSVATPRKGLTAPLVSVRKGTEKEFEAVGPRANGAFLLVTSDELVDLEGLFREYLEGAAIESRAVAAGAVGIVWTSSRPSGVLYRHNASLGPKNTLVLVTIGREEGLRAARLLEAGRQLEFTARVELEDTKPYEADNVIAEIRGGELPHEVVLIGAHLDSWDLGTGALDNGCNVALVIDVARQIRRLGLVPRRTLRFALWNGEEQGMNGSWGYVRTHRQELDHHVAAASFDIGTGRITGFFTNGRSDVLPAVDRALVPVSGLGPFTQATDALSGTDHYDFLVEGVAALVANQDSANYGPNYHARSDTFDKADVRQLRLNAAIAGALAWGLASGEVSWKRLTGEEVAAIVEGSPSLQAEMHAFDLWDDFRAGRRGRRPEGARAPSR
jgi:hypothetical protein